MIFNNRAAMLGTAIVVLIASIGHGARTEMHIVSETLIGVGLGNEQELAKFSKIAINSGAALVQTTSSQQSVVKSVKKTKCSKLVHGRTVCKAFGQFILEGLKGYSDDDLSCISQLCGVGLDQCCANQEAVKEKIKGKTFVDLSFRNEQELAKFSKIAEASNAAPAEATSSELGRKNEQQIAKASSTAPETKSSQQSAVKSVKNPKCKKFVHERTVCKDFGQFILEGLKGYSDADLSCISQLCREGLDQCCTNQEVVKEKIEGKTFVNLGLRNEQELAKFLTIAEA